MAEGAGLETDALNLLVQVKRSPWSAKEPLSGVMRKLLPHSISGRSREPVSLSCWGANAIGPVGGSGIRAQLCSRCVQTGCPERMNRSLALEDSHFNVLHQVRTQGQGRCEVRNVSRVGSQNNQLFTDGGLDDGGRLCPILCPCFPATSS